METANLDDFIKLMHDDYYEAGYLEYETGKTIDEYNGIAHVFQGFYSKDSEKIKRNGALTVINWFILKKGGGSQIFFGPATQTALEYLKNICKKNEQRMLW